MRPAPALGICILALATVPVPSFLAQVPDDDPKEAQARWYQRERERPDLVRGAFEVLRFPTGYTFAPRYRHDPENRKRLLNPDFRCNHCVREGRIPGPAVEPGLRLMDREGDQVLGWIAEKLRSQDYVFIEDEDFKLFWDLPGMHLKMFPNPFLEEELEELGDIFPEVSGRTVIIDAHKRAHLYLIRAHRLLRDFWWLVGTTNEGVQTSYPYLGPHMGMNGKQELYLFNKQSPYEAFCEQFIGRTSSDGHCWHLFRDRAMVLVMHAQGQDDPFTQNSYLHRLMHNLLDAYRMYAFKLPAWFQMGMGHWVERRENTRFNTFCFSEGTLPRFVIDPKWLPKVKKKVLADEVEPFVAVMARQEYGEFPPEYHTITYSWVSYLFRLGPERMKVFINALKDKQQSETLYQAQIRALREAYGLTPIQFDEGWRAWVRQVYPDL